MKSANDAVKIQNLIYKTYTLNPLLNKNNMKRIILSMAIVFSTLCICGKRKLIRQNKNIEGVTITKQVFKKQSDRFVYDVAASPVAKGNTTFDLLKQTPLLSSTDDKTLKIAGKNNALIYINGRKSNMDAESLVQFLKKYSGRKYPEN